MPRRFPVGRHDIHVPVAVSERVERDLSPIRRPSRREIAAFMHGQGYGLATRDRHLVDVTTPTPIRVECQPSTIGGDINAFDRLVASRERLCFGGRPRPVLGNRHRPDVGMIGEHRVGQDRSLAGEADRVGVEASGQAHWRSRGPAGSVDGDLINVSVAGLIRDEEQTSAARCPDRTHIDVHIVDNGDGIAPLG